MTDVEAYKMALTNDDSDDEEDVAVTLGIGTSPGGGGPSMDIPKVLNMEDFEELKKKTLSLVDPEWKQSRNQELLAKMLALDSPSITPQMVEFLAQEDVCELLMNYVTQCDAALTRPTLKDEATPELKMAHKVTMLLTADDPSDGLKMLLSRRATFIMRLVMDIFDDKSAGSFYHAYRIVDLLVRFFPLEVLTALTSDGNLSERIMSMLRHLGCPPVAELVAMLVSLSPVSRDTELYANAAQARIEFITELQEMDFLSRLVDVVVTPEAICAATPEVPLEVHSQFACQLFQEVVEKLSMEYEGAVMLEPFVQSRQLERVLTTVTDPQARGFTRRNCSKMLDVLLRQASEPELMSALGVGGGGGMGAPQTVPNRLYPLRDDIIEHLSSGFERLVNLVLTFEPTKEDLTGSSGMELGGGVTGKENFVYSTHSVAEPFSTLRVNFIDLVALLVESDETVAGKIPAALWRQLIAWALAYPQNNVFHSIFYRLVFCVIKQQRADAQRTLFEHAGFVEFMCGTFLPLRSDGPAAVEAAGGEANVVGWRTPDKDEDKALVNRYILRGIILNCANACRLQALTQAPSSFLRSYLTQSAAWKAFLPVLIGASDMQRSFGLGIAVQDGSKAYFHSAAALSEMMTDGEDGSSTDGDAANSLGLGGHFAHNLGFYDDMCWDDLGHDEQEQEDGDGDGDGAYDMSGGNNAGAGTPQHSLASASDRDSVSSSGGRDSLGSPGSGDRDSLGERRNRLSGGGSGSGFNRSPHGHSMYVPVNLEADESDVVDGILGPSSPAAQRIIEAGGAGSPQGRRGSRGDSPGSSAAAAAAAAAAGSGSGSGSKESSPSSSPCKDSDKAEGDGEGEAAGSEADAEAEAENVGTGAVKTLNMDSAADGSTGASLGDDDDGGEEKGVARV